MYWIEQLMFTEEDLLVLGFHTVSYSVVVVLCYSVRVWFRVVYQAMQLRAGVASSLVQRRHTSDVLFVCIYPVSSTFDTSVCTKSDSSAW